MSDLARAEPATSSVALNQGAARDLTRIDQAIRDQVVADLGTRSRPGQRSVRVDRAQLLGEYLTDRSLIVVLHWLASSKRQSVETKRGYADDLIGICRWLTEQHGAESVDLFTRLRATTVTNWVLWARNQGKAVRTQRRVLSALSSLYTYAITKGLAVVNPVDWEEHALPVGTSTTGRPAGATRVLKIEQVAALRSACRTAEEHLVIGLLCVQGFRESEIVDLLVENIDRDQSPVVLDAKRKGGLWARRYLDDPEIVEHLDAHLDGRTSGPLLLRVTKSGAVEPAPRHHIINVTRRLARRAGIPDPHKVTPHVLRGSAITSLLNDGKPLQEVQMWAAHADPTTTQAYWERENAVERDAALSASLTAKLDAAASGIGAGERHSAAEPGSAC